MEDSKEKMILEELKGWLSQGIVCLDSDYMGADTEAVRKSVKLNTMKMVLGKIDELERSM